MSEGTQSGEYWAKDGPYGQAIQQLSAKSAGLRQSPLAEPFRQQLSPADRLSQEIVANRYLQSIALLDSLLIALVKEATESFELDVQSMNLPEKARQFVAGEISMPGTIPLLSAASSGNTLCEACAVYAGPSLSFQTNDQNQPVCGADLFSESTAHANSAAFYC